MNLPTIDDDGYELDDAEQIHSEHPDTFYIPPLEVRSALQPGEMVKLLFRIELEDDEHSRYQEVERMWVEVVRVLNPCKYLGLLANDAYCAEDMKMGMDVVFEARHIIDIEYKSDSEN